MGIGGSKLELNELSDGCYLPYIVDDVKGLASNSASPTDTWIITTKGGVYYEKQRIKKLFLKYFIDPYSLPLPLNTDQKDLYISNMGLRYEVSVYRDVIRPLIDYDVCKNFIKYLGSGYSCKKSSLVSALTESGITEEDAKNALMNTTMYMGNRWGGRPAIQNNTLPKPPGSYYIYFDSINSIPKDLSYTLLMNEVIPPNAFTLHDIFKKNMAADYSIKGLFSLWYEIAYSCYCMSLSGLNHNDLHNGNIYIVPRSKPINIRYKIEDLDPVIVFSDHEVKIFDFDRAYSERIGINMLNTDKHLQNYGNTNTFVPIKDFYKVFITYAMNKKFQQIDILKLFCGDDMSKKGKLLKYMQDMNAIFYMYNGKYIGDDYLNSLNSPLEFMRELAKFNPKPQETQFDESYSVSNSMFKDGKLILDTKSTGLQEEVENLKNQLKLCNERVKDFYLSPNMDIDVLEPEVMDIDILDSEDTGEGW